MLGLMTKKKERLDKVLLDLGLVETRTKAQAIILSGIVYVNGQKVDKSGTLVNPETPIQIKGERIPYVSRGGLKLESALKKFNIGVTGLICMDIGVSTGGFSDCLLQKGAKKIYAVDVGYGQVDNKLRNDTRVVIIEKTNARYLTANEIPEGVDFITIDVSFISLKHIIPVAKEFLKENGILLPLVKPQFEAGKKDVQKGGVVKDPNIREKVLNEMIEFIHNSDFAIQGSMECPVHGPAGNIEYFILAEKN